MKTEFKRWNDTVTMTKRCLLCSKRNPDTLLTSILLPALMMILFVSLYGRIIQVEGVSYANYIVPGVFMQCIGQCASVTAVMVNRDMTSGIVHRFCTLPIKQGAVLNGHILEALIRSTVTSVVVFFAALLLGVRPAMGVLDAGVFCLLLFGSMAALSYAGMLVGITAGSAEGASALSAFVIILPYVSSGFVPVETLPPVMRVFAQYQPMTPIIDTMRNALMGKPLEVDVCLTALLWCAGVSVALYLISAGMFQKKVISA